MLELVASNPELKTDPPKRKVSWAILMAVLVDRMVYVVTQIEQFITTQTDQGKLEKLQLIHKHLMDRAVSFTEVLGALGKGPQPEPAIVTDFSPESVRVNLLALEGLAHRAWTESFKDHTRSDAASVALTRATVEAHFLGEIFTETFFPVVKNG